MSYYPSTWNAWSSAMDSRSLWRRQGRQEEELFNVVVVVAVAAAAAVVVVSAIHDHICLAMLHFLVSCHCSWVEEHRNICLPVMITKKVYFLLRTPEKKNGLIFWTFVGNSQDGWGYWSLSGGFSQLVGVSQVRGWFRQKLETFESRLGRGPRGYVKIVLADTR